MERWIIASISNREKREWHLFEKTAWSVSRGERGIVSFICNTEGQYYPWADKSHHAGWNLLACFLHWSWYTRLNYLQSEMEKSNAFYNGEMGQMSSKHVNGHRSSCMIVNSDLPIPIHKIPSAPFPGMLVHPCHSKTPRSQNHVRHQFETAYQLVL